MGTTRFASAFVALAAVAQVAVAQAPAQDPGETVRTLSFGIVPQFEQRKLHAAWSPILEELQRRTGIRLEFLTTLTIAGFERELAEGRYDFVYANPFHILAQIGKQSYEPIIRDREPLRGVLVVSTDSPIQRPADLAGKVVAMPSPNALGASLLMRADLERLLHVTVKPLYVRTHSSVYLHVVKGLAAAGGGVEKTLQEQEAPIRERLRVIYTTRPMPSHPVAAHPRVSKDDREAVRRAFLELAATPEGQRLLSKIPMKEATAASMADYRPLLGWGLEAYWDATWRDD